MKYIIFFTLAVLCIATKWHQLHNYSFEDYEKEFEKKYFSEAERQLRKSIFETRLEQIKQHNADETKTWKEGVNHLTDLTAAEFRALLGNKHNRAATRTSFPEVSEADLARYEAVDIDWRTKGAVTAVKDQGPCGSCWTFAAAETLESWWFLAGHPLPILSEQQIIDCTPNPHHCGGTGGCGGGTAELAYDRIMVMGGLALERDYPYRATDGRCKFTGNTTNPGATLMKYVNLPVNEYPPVIAAIQNGPLGISVDASRWQSYESGVMTCDMSNPDLDHAVQLVGYGTDDSTGKAYFLVRNSWTSRWGDNGYIRLERYLNNQPCGIDKNPSDGDGCDDGPPEVTVCGACGILYDVLYPVVKA